MPLVARVARPVCPLTVVKAAGADVELSNFILGRDGTSGYEASRLLLEAIDGIGEALPEPRSTGRPDDPREIGRKWLSSNGGCVYIDLDHLEVCIPEVVGPYDHLAYWYASLHLVSEALRVVARRLPAGQSIRAIVNNTDGHGHSHGGHLSFLVTRRMWTNLMQRKAHQLQALASFLASSVVYTGQGKVGSDNGLPDTGFQLSQRADFMECLVGPQTTFNRPLVNARCEPLCGESVPGCQPAPPALARLHLISLDSNLCQVAHWLKIGTLQVILAMLEAEALDSRLALDDPVEAMRVWSRDPSLGARALMIGGEALTAVELQQQYLEAAGRFLATAGGALESVPHAAEILSRWNETLTALRRRDVEVLARRLDWVLKRTMLERVRQRHALEWHAPAIRHLDQIYGSLDRENGPFWIHDRHGAVEHLVTGRDIARATATPPTNTRAWTRAMLLRRAGPHRVNSVDWDHVTCHTPPEPKPRTVALAHPLTHSRRDAEAAFRRSRTLAELLAALEGSPATPVGQPALRGSNGAALSRRPGASHRSESEETR